MTTFQAIIYAIIHGFSAFLPISLSAHERLIPFLLNWTDHPPAGALMAALDLGVALSVLVYFIHDWASILSSFLQVILFRKKPMTLDERMPLFLFFTGLPLAAAFVYLKPIIDAADWSSPLILAGILSVGAFPLFFAERRSRKTKGMFDWNWFDALLVGVFGILALVPGFGIPETFMPASLLRGYNREAAAKYCYFAIFPIWVVSCYLSFHDVSLHGVPGPDLSWLSFGVAVIVSFFSGLLAIGGLMKHIQRSGYGQYLTYRILLGISTVAVFWFRTRT